LGILFAVIAVLAALIAFFILIIRSLAARVGKFAQNNMLIQSSIFDELIMKKEETLEAILREIEGAEKQLAQRAERRASPRGRAAAAAAPKVRGVKISNYRDPGFHSVYKDIREGFSRDKRDCLREVLSALPPRAESASVEAARRTLASIDGDTRYLLSTVTGEDQLAILDQTLDAEQRQLLAEYVSARETFEAYEYFAWLEQYVFESGTRIIVRTGAKNDNFNGMDSRIRTEYDPTLCEGIYVVAGGKQYDFAIRNKEISG
jgi:hypothetical protein